MKVVKNSYDGSNQVQFEGKLISIAANPLNNVNGTPYRPCTIEFTTQHGELKRVSALMYERNFAYGVEVGNSYLCTASKTNTGVLISVSHLPQDTRATEDDFNFEGATAYEEAKAVEVEFAEAGNTNDVF